MHLDQNFITNWSETDNIYQGMSSWKHLQRQSW